MEELSEKAMLQTLYTLNVSSCFHRKFGVSGLL